MIATPYMNLIGWDQGGDFFTHAQLNANFVEIDGHDHSFGNGKQIGTAGIAPQSVTTTLIANNAVGSAQIADAAVGTSEIQNNAITTALLASLSVTNAILAEGAVTTDKLDPNIVPLGSVTMWYRPAGSSSTPGGGWEIMDGRPWSSISNLLGATAGNIPDMRNVFPIGADITGGSGPGIGVTGGSNTINLAHAHAVSAHAHGIPDHAHWISSDGQHLHTWVGGLNTWSRANAFVDGLTINDHFGVQRQNNSYTLYIKNIETSEIFGGIVDDNAAHMDQAGSHNHGGGTGGTTVALGTNLATAGTDSQLGSNYSIKPQNVSLLFIMRVR